MDWYTQANDVVALKLIDKMNPKMLNIKNSEGKTALDIAHMYKRPQIVEALKKKTI